MTVLIPVFLLMLLGVGGLLASNKWVRLALWVVSAPSFCVGVYALIQGGIGDRFTPAMMWKLCVIAFWPVIGCAIGEVIVRRQKREESGETV